MKSKLKTILYPYVIWSLIAGGIELAASPWVNSPITWIDLLQIPFFPIEQFWFLYALFVIQAVIIALYPRKVAVYLIGALLPLLVVFADLPAQLVQGALYFPYVAGGIAAAALLAHIETSSVRSKWVMLILAWLAFTLLMIGRLQYGFGGLLPGYLAGFAGTFGTIALAMLLANWRHKHVLVGFGRASMAIYVMHTIVSAGTRIGLGMINLTHAATVVLLSTITGLLLPYIAYTLARTYGVAGLFGFGAELGGRSSERTGPLTAER